MTHPYRHAPDYRRWRTAMSGREAAAIEPFPAGGGQIGAQERIMTAGSCFAQHITRHLRARQLRLVDTEPAHPLLPEATAAACGYGLYSARYGNIYTSRQLLQLLRRCEGRFQPADAFWDDHGAFHDPFRPSIQPGGFASRDELEHDRRMHLDAVRRAFAQMDVLIFTMGLTECWFDRTDGAVYPLCPGTAAGRFDAARHGFVNLGVDEVVDDMTHFLAELRRFNPRARIMLTVSPVPLAATALDRHVLVSTTCSKAVLRVAAETLTRIDGVHYFPSCEIVSADSANFSDDRRSVRESCVQRVMEQFFRHVMPDSPAPPADTPAAEPAFTQRMQDVIDTLCDERHLDPPPRS